MALPSIRLGKLKSFPKGFIKILGLIALVYFVLNIFVTYSAINDHSVGEPGLISGFADDFRALSYIDSFISDMTEGLDVTKGYSRVDVAVDAYSFALGTFIVFSAICILLTYLRIRMVNDHEIMKFHAFEKNIEDNAAMWEPDKSRRLDRRAGIRFGFGFAFLIFIFGLYLMRVHILYDKVNIYIAIVFLTSALMFLHMSIFNVMARYLLKDRLRQKTAT